MPRHRARLRPYPARADDARVSSSSPPRSLTRARSTETTAPRRARPAARNAAPASESRDSTLSRPTRFSRDVGEFARENRVGREFADVARLRGARARASADVGDASDAFEGGAGDEDGRARAEDEETWATGRENSPS